MATKSNNATDKDLVWTTDLQGMNNRQDMDKIPTNSSPLLVNVSLDKPGTWAKRKGSALTGTTQSGAGVMGLVAYSKNDGTYKLQAVRSTDLDTYDETLDSWSAISTGAFTASTKVAQVNYKESVYSISTADYLNKNTGGSVTDVNSGTNKIRGNCLAVSQNTLYVGGSPDLGQNRVYYTLYDTVNNLPGEQFWNTGETLPTSTRFIILKGPCTGLYDYNQRILMFTKDNCTMFDIRNDDTQTGPVEVFKIGLANPRAVTTCNGYLIFMSPDKRIWAWGGAGQPTDISWAIEDDSNGMAICNLIADSEIANVCAGSLRNKVYFSVGDITFMGTTYSNVCIKGLFNQQGNSVLWSLDTYPVKPSVFSNMVLDNQEVLMFGASGVDDVYLMNVGQNDNGIAVPFKAVTKFFDFNNPIAIKEADKMFIKFKPQVTPTTCYLAVRYALNGNFSYSDVSTPDSVVPVTNHGVINMYRGGVATDLDEILWVLLPAGTNFRTISIEFSNDQLDEGAEISALAFAYSLRPLDIRSENI